MASASLREMIKPGALAILSPMAVGIIFRILGHATGQPLLGAKVVASMLMFATVIGILMALFLNTSGGAWDNAKKYIETGALGGKGSESHKAAITGDTQVPNLHAAVAAFGFLNSVCTVDQHTAIWAGTLWSCYLYLRVCCAAGLEIHLKTRQGLQIMFLSRCLPQSH